MCCFLYEAPCGRLCRRAYDRGLWRLRGLPKHPVQAFLPAVLCARVARFTSDFKGGAWYPGHLRDCGCAGYSGGSIENCAVFEWFAHGAFSTRSFLTAGVVWVLAGAGGVLGRSDLDQPLVPSSLWCLFLTGPQWPAALQPAWKPMSTTCAFSVFAACVGVFL